MQSVAQSIVKIQGKNEISMKAAWIRHEFNTNLIELLYKALWIRVCANHIQTTIVCLFHFWIKILTVLPKNMALPPHPNHQPKPPVLFLLKKGEEYQTKSLCVYMLGLVLFYKGVFWGLAQAAAGMAKTVRFGRSWAPRRRRTGKQNAAQNSMCWMALRVSSCVPGTQKMSTHTDESSTWLSGVVRGRASIWSRPHLKYIKHGPKIAYHRRNSPVVVVPGKYIERVLSLAPAIQRKKRKCRYVFTGWGGCLRWPETPPHPLRPPAENCSIKTERFLNSGDIETWKMQVVVNRKAAVIIRFHRGEFGRVNTVFLGAFTHTPPEGDIHWILEPREANPINKPEVNSSNKTYP